MYVALMRWPRNGGGLNMAADYAMVGKTEEEAVSKMFAYMQRQGYQTRQYPVYVGVLTDKVEAVMPKVEFKKTTLKETKAKT